MVQWHSCTIVPNLHAPCSKLWVQALSAFDDSPLLYSAIAEVGRIFPTRLQRLASGSGRALGLGRDCHLIVILVPIAPWSRTGGLRPRGTVGQATARRRHRWRRHLICQRVSWSGTGGLALSPPAFPHPFPSSMLPTPFSSPAPPPPSTPLSHSFPMPVTVYASVNTMSAVLAAQVRAWCDK